ncbi:MULTISPECIES: heterocyst development glycosyltransferase HepC [Leptolyngbya]|uniref:heterocyst development glycosyltransferase HepC n=1 Tax=Leptolyngbya TaxID=47251 RepID=UPI001688CACC|nr:heterocyst development glycosyltransferase HepC [Leptolyngbya sp. FACHB-1624]MBD1855671.1 sugar transferase [Leptolyngbya sp. FACHB-1624]
MTTFDPLFLQETQSSTWEKSELETLRCSLYWRQQQLLVLQPPVSKAGQSSDHTQRASSIRPLRDPNWLSECLKRSTVQLVRADLDLGEPALKSWAEACESSGKALYLRLPSAAYLPHKHRGWRWGCKRVADWILAGVGLIVLSPILLVIALAIALTSPGSIFFSQWRVGKRGKLFRVLKFRTMTINADQQHHRVMADQSIHCLHKREDDPRITAIGKWLRRYSLDELPQLINVLRGEMSLVGPRPWALYDAVRLSADMQLRLNALPGMTGAWQVSGRSTQLDLETVSQQDLDYLHNWSFRGDVQILLRTLPKVLSGFGAF